MLQKPEAKILVPASKSHTEYMQDNFFIFKNEKLSKFLSEFVFLQLFSIGPKYAFKFQIKNHVIQYFAYVLKVS